MKEMTKQKLGLAWKIPVAIVFSPIWILGLGIYTLWNIMLEEVRESYRWGRQVDRYNSGKRKIILNGRPVNLETPELSYERLMEIQGERPDRILSVTYHRAEGPGSDGILSPGKSIRCLDGTIINAMDTSAA